MPFNKHNKCNSEWTKPWFKAQSYCQSKEYSYAIGVVFCQGNKVRFDSITVVWVFWPDMINSINQVQSSRWVAFNKKNERHIFIRPVYYLKHMHEKTIKCI